MKKHKHYKISSLKAIYTNNNTGLFQLNMAQIDASLDAESFDDLRDIILSLRYPCIQSHKLETFGFSLSHFRPSVKSLKGRYGPFEKRGIWRAGAHEEDAISALYLDIDNAMDRPILSQKDVGDRLNNLGLSWFSYTSFSHTPEKPKYRVVIDIDRDVTRREALRLAVYLNQTVCGQQADLTIYDPADFLFAPPFKTEIIENLGGSPVQVDEMLNMQRILEEREPALWSSYVSQKVPRERRPQTPTEQQRAATLSLDQTVRDHISIENHEVFNPSWMGFYRHQVCGGHRDTMRQVLAMAWAKNRAELTYGEMRHLLNQIDETGGDYFMRVHGDGKAIELVKAIMALAVAVEEVEAPLLDVHDIGLKVEVKEAECGEGKTRDELRRMGSEKGRYVYVVDKIETMAKRQSEFREVAGPLAAMRFFVREAHSRQSELRVPLQLANIRKDLDKETAKRPSIVWVTQAAAAQMDWSNWSDCEIIFDEVPDCFQIYRINDSNHRGLLRELIKTEVEDGNCYSLGLTSAGMALSRRTDIDDYDRVHHGLCALLGRPNTHVWVKKSAWDTDDLAGSLEFFSLTSPLNLMPFLKVRLLGDEAMKSVLVKVWTEQWGVLFEAVEFARRDRTVPTKDRVTIRYFSVHRDASMTRFAEGDGPLEAISAHIHAASGDQPVLWTANERFRDRSKLDQSDYISPKAHGRNDLQHYNQVAWLTAMKASQFEISALREICGMTAPELIEAREYNAAYQFVMRSSLRNFESDAPVIVYVFSRKQADYLRSRLGGTLEKIGGVVLDKRPRCLDAEGPMTDAERAKVSYWRAKARKENVDDVRALQKACALLDDRLAKIVNLGLKEAS